MRPDARTRPDIDTGTQPDTEARPDAEAGLDTNADARPDTEARPDPDTAYSLRRNEAREGNKETDATFLMPTTTNET